MPSRITAVLGPTNTGKTHNVFFVLVIQNSHRIINGNLTDQSALAVNNGSRN